MKKRTELMIQLSYKCNLRCIHCSYGDLHEGPENDYPKYSGFLWKHNPKIVKISGGEPTIHRDWEYVLYLSKERETKVVAFTNGLGSPKEHPDFYWVSLYGNRKIHNGITQANTFARTVEFIRNHDVEYLNSPVFSRQQLKSLKEMGEKLEIPLRITRLLPHGSAFSVLRLDRQVKLVKSLKLNRKPNWITCSLGLEPPRCWKKMCLKPDGAEVVCTALIRGLQCPFRKKITPLLWNKLFTDDEDGN